MGCCVKEEEYSKLQKDAAKYAKAFAHPARVAILELLVKQCDCICNDLVKSLPLAQSTVSQHIKILKEVGLIDGIEKSPAIEYHLNKKKWFEAKQAMKDFFEE
ncbi:MAG: metalloregulator ArsR/SmtB family transcription factor [Ignavibacteriales bacterium]|nr:metalloregulator ArsR/SmtB family transcription factor [Ignavibacteriales bacterium]